MRKCVVCMERRMVAIQTCDVCDQNWLNSPTRSENFYAWAARRARAFERKRCKEKQK